VRTSQTTLEDSVLLDLTLSTALPIVTCVLELDHVICDHEGVRVLQVNHFPLYLQLTCFRINSRHRSVHNVRRKACLDLEDRPYKVTAPPSVLASHLVLDLVCVVCRRVSVSRCQRCWSEANVSFPESGLLLADVISGLEFISGHWRTSSFSQLSVPLEGNLVHFSASGAGNVSRSLRDHLNFSCDNINR
jgi:hypothetical protein